MSEQKSLSEMTAMAKEMHPKAYAALGVDKQWEIRLDTGFSDLAELPEEFAGTPAAIAFTTIIRGESELDAWAERMGYEDLSVEEVAARFNLARKHNEEFFIALDGILAAQNLPSEEWMRNAWGKEEIEISDEVFSAYKQARRQLLAQMEPGFEAERQALGERLNG